MNQERLHESVSFIKSQPNHAPTIAIVLGSGLGDFADELPSRTVISTSTIPHYPRSSVAGHKGKLVFGLLGEKPILAFQGRSHFYESGNLDSVLYPILVAHQLGIRTLIVTNAAGGINRTFAPGDLMILSDQINFTLQPFAQQPGVSRSGKPIYSLSLIAKAEQAAAEKGIIVRKGIYVGLKGPTYETASEVEMLARIGADAVGMSTVFETSLASSYGMEILGISCITNLGTGISSTKLNHAEVTAVGKKVRNTFADLISQTVNLL